MGRERAHAAHTNRESPWRPGVCQRDDSDRHRAAAAASRRRRYDGQTDPASNHPTDRIETGKAKSHPEVEAGAGRVVIQHRLQRMAGDKPDIIVVEGLAKHDLPAPAQCVLRRRDKDQVIDGERKGFHLRRRDSLIAGYPYISEVRGNGADDLAARSLLQVDIDVRMCREKPAQGGRQKLLCCRRIGKQMNMAAQSFGVFRQFPAHAFQLESDHPRVVAEGRPGRGRRTPRRPRSSSGVPNVSSMARTRSLADANAIPARAAPWVMLLASRMCTNSRKSVRSKRIVMDSLRLDSTPPEAA